MLQLGHHSGLLGRLTPDLEQHSRPKTKRFDQNHLCHRVGWKLISSIFQLLDVCKSRSSIIQPSSAQVRWGAMEGLSPAVRPGKNICGLWWDENFPCQGCMEETITPLCNFPQTPPHFHLFLACLLWWGTNLTDTLFRRSDKQGLTPAVWSRVRAIL